MQGAEIELKFPVDNEAALRATAERLGFRLVTERTFEENTLYDTEERLLKSRRQILRVRQYGDLITVTHKRMASGDIEDTRYKTRIETESAVEDGAAMAEIFTQLGYGPVFRYEKFRTEWEMNEGHLVLDETPIGLWAELEGPIEWIDSILEKLEIDPETCSKESYGKLFLAWKERTGSPAENLTFEEAGSAVAH